MAEFDKSNIISAGVSSGGSLLGGIVNAFTAKKSQQRQYQYNTLLQQQAAQLEQQNWFQQYEKMLNDQLSWREDERLYNDPSSQMARLKAAGLNPTFGNGAGVSAGNYSLNPEMPGTSSSVGSSGVGAPTPTFDFSGVSNAYLQAKNLEVQQRLAKVQETKVGIERDLTDAEIQEKMSNISLNLSKEKLTDTEREDIVKNWELLKANIDKTHNEVQQKWEGLLLQRMQMDLQREIADWQNQRAKERTAIGFIEANAAKWNAETNKGQLELAKQKYASDVQFRARELDNESERLLQSFEKNGLEALNEAIDEASLHLKVTNFGFTYTSPDDLQKQLALINACSRYFDNINVKNIAVDNGWTLKKGVLDAYQKFNGLMQRMNQFQMIAPFAIGAQFGDFAPYSAQPNP